MSSTNEGSQPWKVAAVVSFYMCAALVVSAIHGLSNMTITCLIDNDLQMVFV